MINLSWLLPERKGIPVLMYHKVWPGINDSLTITPERLREQWTYLKNEGYNTLSLHQYLDLINGSKPIPEKAILITFDDGYKNNQVYAYPLLKELGWQATFFIIGYSLEQDVFEEGAEQKMTAEELKQLDPAIVQLGIHGYKHEHMGKIGIEQMEMELSRSVAVFEKCGIAVNKVWAYPYGGRPGNDGQLAILKKMMRNMGFKVAFRIGNRVSCIPAKDPYEITRIDIKGTDTTKELKIKLKKGKLKPF